MKQKRYQYRTKDGVKWTSWFNFDGPEEPIQLKGFKGDHLKNEYRVIE
jgi:hypothetical protein